MSKAGKHLIEAAKEMNTMLQWKARAEKAEAERDEALAENQHWLDAATYTGPSGHPEFWKDRAEKAEALLRFYVNEENWQFRERGKEIAAGTEDDQ